MEWFDYIWETESEEELKKLYISIKNIQQTRNKDILCSIKIALDMKTFWFENLTNLRKMREKKGISISQLAAKTGISLSQIQRLERQECNISKSHFDTVWRLARALGCDATDLIESNAIFSSAGQQKVAQAT